MNQEQVNLYVERMIKKFPIMSKVGKIQYMLKPHKLLEKYRDEKLLIIMVGVQGSGKTTFVKEKFPEINSVNIDCVLEEYLYIKNVEELDRVVINTFLKRIQKELQEKRVCIAEANTTDIGIRLMLLDYLKNDYTKVVILLLNRNERVIIQQIQKEIFKRSRPDLWQDVKKEYVSLKRQIDTHFIERGVDEVYFV